MLSWLSGILLLAGILIIAVSTRSAASPLFNLGMAVFGSGVVAMGLEAILTGHISFRRRRGGRQRYSYAGFSARLYGALFVLFGLVIAGIALLRQYGGENTATAMLGALARTPQGISLLAIAFGVLVVSIGMLSAAGTMEQNASGRAAVSSLSGRLFGILIALVGIALIAFGVAHSVAPALVADYYDMLLGLLN